MTSMSPALLNACSAALRWASFWKTFMTQI
jgi:hypothetical protein